MLIISVVNTYTALCVRHIYLFLVALGLCCSVRAFSSCCVRGNSSLWYMGFSLLWLLLLRSTDSRLMGFSSYSTRAH